MASKNGTRLLAEWQKRLCLQDWTMQGRLLTQSGQEVNTMNDLINRQAALAEIARAEDYGPERTIATLSACYQRILNLPPAQKTIYGYDIEHLAMIAKVLQKEGLPPERVAEALNDIGRIVAIVTNEFEETLRKAVEQCTI